MKKLLFGTLALVLFAGAGCKKNSDNDPCSLSSNSIVGSYKITSAMVKIGNNPEYDEFAEYDECRKDDILTFSANGTFAEVDAGEVCDPTRGTSRTWNLSGNILTFTSMGASAAGTISVFNCAYFILSRTDGTTSVNTTYTRQ